MELKREVVLAPIEVFFPSFQYFAKSSCISNSAVDQAHIQFYLTLLLNVH